MRRVVVTSIGTVNPIGHNIEETWQSILDKKCGISVIDCFDPVNHKVKIAGQIRNLNLEDYLDAKDAKNTDRFINLALIATQEAIKKSNLDLDKIDKTRFGVLFTSGIGGLGSIQDSSITCYTKGPGRISPYFIPRGLINLSAGRIAMEYKAQSYVSSVVTACAASTNAIGDAYLRIAYDQEDIIITGGSESSICEIGIGGFQAMRALTTNEDPLKASMPFDKDRSGFVMGEGAGVLILEELEHALNRGANIIAEVVGYGVSCDANHITAPLLDGSGAAIAIEKAIKSAKIKYEDIGYFNAHGTSTKMNEITESNAIKSVFKDHTKNLYVSSTKGNTGHMLGGTGGVEAVITLMGLQNGIVPPTIGTTNIDEELGLNLPLEPVKHNYKYAMSNSLGFGGHNASIIFKKWDN